MSDLEFNREFDARPGTPVPLAPGLVRLTAPNSGPFTFTGTNCFLIGEADVAVVDPGPDDAGHLAALMAAIGGRRVRAILLTHTHKDHSALAAKLAQKTGAPLWFGGPHRTSRPKKLFEINPISPSCDWALVPDRWLEDGDVLTLGDQRIEVVATPGHCANHLGFGLVGTPYFLSGDHVMGWNTTLVAVPDGSMGDYLSSLQKLSEIAYRVYLPAHGGPIADGPSFARALEGHRQARNRQILERLDKGPVRLGGLVRAIYPGLTGRLGFAARMTLAAHLEYLAENGAVRLWRTPLGLIAFKQ